MTSCAALIVIISPDNIFLRKTMITRASAFAICLAMGRATVAEESQARRTRSWLPLVAAPPAAAPQAAPAAPAATSQGNADNLPDAKYPNGLGWRAIELDFIDVKARISVVEGKVDDVKADTESILSELDDVDADHVTIMQDLDDIKSDLENVAGDIGDMADDVAMLKNAIQVQVSVAAAGYCGTAACG
jgi:peptidoglycan hydrolase CwlO-like protein